jgi:hypothetical protein
VEGDSPDIIMVIRVIKEDEVNGTCDTNGETRNAYKLLVITLMMEAARTSETLNFYQTTRLYNPEDSHLHTHRRENLRSY